jgi:hypothetical protein
MLLPRSIAARSASRHWLGRAAVCLGLAIVATSCSLLPGSGEDQGRLEQQARAVLARWADAVAAAGGPSGVVVVGEPTGQVGDWEETVGQNKAALMAGMLEQDGSLPADAPPDGEVRWPDGTTTRVPVISAVDALGAIRTGAEAPCGDCTPIHVTGARLATGPIATSRGPATGPLWEFTLAGSAVRVTRVAIGHPITVEPLAWDPASPPIGLAIDSASVGGDGGSLTVTFVGAPGPGDRPCGADYTAEAFESDLAVAVIVVGHSGPTIGGCAAVGAMRTTSVDLHDPLGERTVLDGVRGQPVTVSRIP